MCIFVNLSSLLFIFLLRSILFWYIHTPILALSQPRRMHEATQRCSYINEIEKGRRKPKRQQQGVRVRRACRCVMFSNVNGLKLWFPNIPGTRKIEFERVGKFWTIKKSNIYCRKRQKLICFPIFVTWHCHSLRITSFLFPSNITH